MATTCAGPQRTWRAVVLFAAAAACFSLGALPARAAPADVPPAEPAAGVAGAAVTGPGAASAPAPVDRAISQAAIGVLAQILRGIATGGPESMADPGPAIERMVQGLLDHPGTDLMLEISLAKGLQEMPVELREPLAAVVRLFVDRMRRELATGFRSGAR